MKKIRVAMAVLALTVGFSGMSLASGTVTFNVKLSSGTTNWGDGLHIEIGANGIATGRQTGICTNQIIGQLTKLQRENNVAAVVFRDTQYQMLKVIRQNNTWTYYNFNGTVFNSGRWANGTLSKADESAPNSNE